MDWTPTTACHTNCYLNAISITTIRYTIQHNTQSGIQNVGNDDDGGGPGVKLLPINFTTNSFFVLYFVYARNVCSIYLYSYIAIIFIGGVVVAVLVVAVPVVVVLFIEQIFVFVKHSRHAGCK